MRILVVDDQRATADHLVRLLRKRGHEATATYDGREAIDSLRQDRPDLVLTDWSMPGVGGRGVLESAREAVPPIEVVVFTAYGAVDIAVEAMQLGARDFLTKPITLEQLNTRLDEVAALLERRKMDAIPPMPSGTTEPSWCPAVSTKGRQLEELIARIADAPSPVWIEGELGSGREQVARRLHALAPTRSTLVSLEATDLLRGRWPERGHVLIPRVDMLPDQALRMLTERAHHPQTGTRIIVTASSSSRRDDALSRELYYLLAVLVVRVPPLRERREDIIPLYEHALRHFQDRHHRESPPLTEEEAASLVRRRWPGNLRELYNDAERRVVLGGSVRSELGASEGSVPPASDMDLVPQPQFSDQFQLNAYLDEVEKSLLEHALALHPGDRRGVGEFLGVERNALRYKLKKHDLL